MKIAIGNDHVAVEMKNQISEYLISLGHEVINFGTDSSDRISPRGIKENCPTIGPGWGILGPSGGRRMR